MAKMNWTAKENVFAGQKTIQKEEASSWCQSAILSGFDAEVKGILYHFSYDQEAQLNFQDTDRLFQNNMIAEIGWTAYQENRKTRLVLDKETFTQVYLAGVKHKQDCLNHLYDQVLPAIDQAVDAAALELVEWGQPGDSFLLDTSQTLDKQLGKLSEIEQETVAQKTYNGYLETAMLEVADIALMSALM